MIKFLQTNKIMESSVIEKLGGYNDFPPGWAEITPEEYAIRLVNKVVYAIDNRQMRNPGDYRSQGLDGTLFIFGDLSGVAVTSSYQKVDNTSLGGNSSFSNYAYVIKFWSFGCNHSFKEVPWDSQFGIQLRGLHLWQCQLCGQSEVVDSSD